LWAGRLVTLACLLPASDSFGQGNIAYFQPPTPLGYGPVPGFTMLPLDLDRDGVVDFTIDSSLLQSTKVVPGGSNRILALPEPPPDLGSYVHPLQAGEVIFLTSTQGGLAWVDGNGLVRGSTLSACAAPFGCVGPWVGLTAFAGVEFEIAGAAHYGWIRIANFDLGGNVLDWAYETRPGVPIFAGAVPEPSTWALMMGGGLLFFYVSRKKRTETSKHSFDRSTRGGSVDWNQGVTRVRSVEAMRC